MSWPKYYANQILIPSPSGFIGIVSGWTKKEHLAEIISPKNQEKVAAIGQLYSKEGLNYIIRNLFLNPHITKLIVTGKDLSGALKFFKEFLKENQGLQFIHKEIPAGKIQEFRAWFEANTIFADESQINEIIAHESAPNFGWTSEAVDFPDQEQREQTDFPSEEVCFRLEDKKIADLWLKVLDRILKFGVNKMSQYSEMQRELVNITTVINGEDPDNPYLPDYLYFNAKDLENYYPQLMTDHIFEGVEYTYGSRFRNFNGINQVQSIIDDLKANNFSRRAIAFTWDVMKDNGNPKSPCINLIQALVQNEKVYLTTYIRSNDMYRAWPQNAFALRKVQKEIADALNLRMGKLCIVSNSAHIYERDFLAASEMVSNHKPKTECTQDPRGNFIIALENNKITASHFSPEGQFLQKFEGQTARELQNQIFTFVSETLHALDLGKELMKAEIALKNKLPYQQDQELNFAAIKPKTTGTFIVIDGTDGSGKATQTKLLVEKLEQKGYPVKMIDFPQYGQKSAGLVEEYLNGKFGQALEVGPYRASIFYACDRYAAAPQIQKWLDQGNIVIANRYVSSNMGHQAGKIKDLAEREKFLDWLFDLEYNVFGIPKPDLNILLYLPPEIGQELVDHKGSRDYVGGAKRDIHEADLQHLKDAAQAYKYVADKYNWITIDCAPENKLLAIEDIHDLLWQEIRKLI